MKQIIEGNIVDLYHREIFKGGVVVDNGIITQIKHCPTQAEGFIMCGFIDAHVHIESSMLTPENFGRLVIEQGTVAVVTDPHEIANVMGVAGVEFMVENSKKSPIKTFFTIPSCVPATPFNVSGGVISSTDVERMAASGQFVALSEVMNVPGVLNQDKEMMAKLDSAKKYHLPIDGHAPVLSGEPLERYVACGISTDHECAALDEALDKIAAGMKILIREGSAARNYEALKELIRSHPNEVMFCTDDSHPDEIVASGHIDKIVKRAVADGFDLFDVLKIASIHPNEHFHLEVGRLKVGDKADFIIVDNLENFETKEVYIDGQKRYDRASLYCLDDKPDGVQRINNFNHDSLLASSLRKSVLGATKVISVMDGELITSSVEYIPDDPKENLESDLENDVLKIVYINRYHNGTPQIAFCKGFELKKGAFASSIAHDSHNIIAVGCSDSELASVINAVVEQKGALAVCFEESVQTLPLPIGGIISEFDGKKVAAEYKKLSTTVKEMGCVLHAPFMTLSFMSLVVIPEIKIGEKGLFSYDRFDWME